MSTSKTTNKTTNQQEFLRDAMQKLGMTRDQFSKRICVPRPTLDKWLNPPDSDQSREMQAVVWQFVREIVEREKKD